MTTYLLDLGSGLETTNLLVPGPGLVTPPARLDTSSPLPLPRHHQHVRLVVVGAPILFNSNATGSASSTTPCLGQHHLDVSKPGSTKGQLVQSPGSRVE